jgi:hypothetical protein
MDGRDRGDHHGDQNRGRQRREEPEGKQRPTGQLGKAGRERHHPPRTKPKGLEEGAGSIQTVPAEEAEQLLSTVPDEQCANNDAQHQQSECHLHLLSRRTCSCTRN